MFRIAGSWIMFFGIYLFFAAPVSISEVIAGVGSATVVTGFSLIYRGARERRFDLRAPWLHVVGRALASVPLDCLRVARVMLRSLLQREVTSLGAPARQPFVHGGGTARDAGRRAIVVLATSLAPNGYVLMMPEGSELMVLHRLAPVPPRPDREWPL